MILKAVSSFAFFLCVAGFLGIASAATINCTSTTCDGTSNPDTITGTTGSDTIHGKDGADQIYTHTGVPGTGGTDADSIFSAKGGDTIYANDGDGLDSIDCGAGTDTVNLDYADTAASNCETVNRGAQPPPPPNSCNLYADATAGADTNAGSSSAPFKTVQKLVNTLSSGQTGCLNAGTFSEQNIAVHSPGITVKSTSLTNPAKIYGRLVVWPDAPGVTFRDMKLDGKGGTYEVLSSGQLESDPNPTVAANDTKWLNLDVTNQNTGICFVVGNSVGRADRTLIRDSKIHGCGILPATNYDHGIYLSITDGSQVVNNFVYDNADRGIQLYGDVDHALVDANTVDKNGAGVGIGGSGGTSDNNRITNNILSNSTGANGNVGWNLYANSGSSGGVVDANCAYATASGYTSNGGIAQPNPAYTVTNTLIAPPTFVNRASGDLNQTSGSACAGYGATLT